MSTDIVLATPRRADACKASQAVADDGVLGLGEGHLPGAEDDHRPQYSHTSHAI